MTDMVPPSDQQQTEDFARQIEENTRRIDDLANRVDASESRADAADMRADAADLRAEVSEAQAAVDREILASVQIDGELARAHVEQLERALQTSRTIGAAIGVLMATLKVDQDQALAYLKRKSSETNVKLFVLCAQIVEDNHG
jgi:hypothetical protein